jgi:hypothetical protein
VDRLLAVAPAVEALPAVVAEAAVEAVDLAPVGSAVAVVHVGWAAAPVQATNTR